MLHCGTGDAVGLGLGDFVGVGVGLGDLVGVAVGVGDGLGVAVANENDKEHIKSADDLSALTWQVPDASGNGAIDFPSV